MPIRIPGPGMFFESPEGGSGYPSTGPLPPGHGVDPDYGAGHPIPPIAAPPIYTPPGHIQLPIVIPPEVALPPFPGPPIVIDPPEDKPNPVPPGELWPPIGPEYAGKIIAVIVLGEGKVHWYHVPPPSTEPPSGQPKR